MQQLPQRGTPPSDSIIINQRKIKAEKKQSKLFKSHTPIKKTKRGE
jgi:hypothetical protein